MLVPKKAQIHTLHFVKKFSCLKTHLKQNVTFIIQKEDMQDGVAQMRFDFISVSSSNMWEAVLNDFF